MRVLAGVDDILARLGPILDSRVLRGAVGIVEEGGELVAISLCGLVLADDPAQ